MIQWILIIFLSPRILYSPNIVSIFTIISFLLFWGFNIIISFPTLLSSSQTFWHIPSSFSNPWPVLLLIVVTYCDSYGSTSELIKTQRTGHTSERFFSFLKSFEVGRFNSNLDLWGRKSHFYNPDIFKWDDPPLICISSGAGSQYKGYGRRKLVFPCFLVLASKYITSLAL